MDAAYLGLELTPAQQVIVAHMKMHRSGARRRLDPCPAEERVEKWYDVPDVAPDTKTGKEGEVTGDDGVHYQKCGGGRRIVRKKIGGG